MLLVHRPLSTPAPYHRSGSDSGGEDDDNQSKNYETSPILVTGEKGSPPFAPCSPASKPKVSLPKSSRSAAKSSKSLKSLLESPPGSLGSTQSRISSGNQRAVDSPRNPREAAPLTRREKLTNLIKNEDWDKAGALLSDGNWDLARQPFRLVCKGENCVVSLAHYVCVNALESRNRPNMSLIEGIFKSNLAGLRFPDSRGERLPLHMVCLFLKNDVAEAGSPDTFARDLVELLVSSDSKALKIQDSEGNLPLHHAYMNSLSVARQLLAKCPAACAISNNHGRLPLHILCSRVCVSDAVSVGDDLRGCIDAFPRALSSADRYGRLPLHVACQTLHPTWDLLQCLFREYPAALLIEDKLFQTPLALAKSLRAVGYDGNEKHDVVLAGLTERTAEEAKKSSSGKKGFLGGLSERRARRRRRRGKNQVDLMNCYG